MTNSNCFSKCRSEIIELVFQNVTIQGKELGRASLVPICMILTKDIPKVSQNGSEATKL